MIYPLFLDRMTDLSVDEINARLNESPDDSLVNDLGVLLYISGCPVAEQTLSEMLFTADESVRFTAYCHLARVKTLSTRTYLALHQFMNDPRNREIITDARDRLWIHIN
jgi:hypothetical protein